jgi:hypothetical protein
MSMYADDYGLVDIHYIVHACMVDLGADHPGEKPEYLIGFVLHVGHQGYHTSISSPQRSLPDRAFEELVALVKREGTEVEDDEEDAL